MWTWIKALFSKAGTVLQPLLRILLSRVGKMMLNAATNAVQEVARQSSGLPWNEALQIGVNKAIAELESQGLKLGVDFFLNDLIGAITNIIADNWENKQ